MVERVTIKSIARDLGISHMTVSRALSNHPSVHDETRAIVLKRAAELGYVKSAVATAMRGEATGTVGLLVPTLTNEFYARFANAFALRCEDLGLQVITHVTNDDIGRETSALLRLREMRADGVVLVPAPGASDSAPQFGDMTAVQLIRRRPDIAQAGWLGVEDTGSIGAAVDHLRRRGHSRIAYIGGSAEVSSGRARLRAFREAMRRNGLKGAPDLIRTAPPSFEAGWQGLAGILERAAPATALVCGAFEMSNGALEACLRLNLSLPGDLAFVGYGDPAFYEWIQGGITTIALPVDDLAERTSEMIAGHRAGTDDLAIPAALVIRRSG